MPRTLAPLVVFVVASCGTAPLDLSVAPMPRSNVRASDYVGPEACGECHGKRFSQWRGNLHRAMNRLAGDEAALVGDFSGVEINYAGGTARFDRDAEGPTMTLSKPDGERWTYRVTRTIGSRYIQEYVGVSIAPVASDIELRLPFGYWLREKRWFHQQFFDSWFGPEYAESGEPTIDPTWVDPTPWATRCAWCHNTYPFELRLARRQAAEPIGAGPETLYQLERAPTVTDNHLPLRQVVTVGISCESCHFGGREHAEGADIEFRPMSPDLTSVSGSTPMSGERREARTINLVCMQCHSAPAPKWPSGASQRNSSEALDMTSGACASAIKCTDCHDPHPRGQAAGADTSPEHLAACGRCHQRIADNKADHAKHSPADATCIDCHMPRITQGFSGPLRTHRVTTPTPRQILAGREPDACGLCHLDRSSRQLAVDLVTGWGMRPATGDWQDIDRPIGERWLASKSASLRIVAAAAYGTTRDHRALPRLVAMLDEPVAFYRMRILFAIEAILGRDIEPDEFDPTAPPAERAAAQATLRRTLP